MFGQSEVPEKVDRRDTDVHNKSMNKSFVSNYSQDDDADLDEEEELVDELAIKRQNHDKILQTSEQVYTNLRLLIFGNAKTNSKKEVPTEELLQNYKSLL